MGPDCKVCVDPRVRDIDRALEGGQSVRDVGEAFGFTKSTLGRHALHRKRSDASPPPTGERRPCLVCSSPDRAEIEAALLRLEPAETIAAAIDGPSADTILRHAHGCMASALQAARGPEVQAMVKEAQAAVERLADQAKRLVDAAELEGTIRERAAAIATAAKCFELLARITGELGPDRELLILQLPEWQRIQRTIMEALRPFPDAYEAVASALEHLDAQPQPRALLERGR
jgi:hypothetical protein